MNVFSAFKAIVELEIESLVADGTLPEGTNGARVSVDPPRDASHGDLSTNAAMVLAKPAGLKPRDLAETLAERLRTRDSIESVDVAGPGFINLRLHDEYWRDLLVGILAAGEAYGESDLGQGRPVNIEYVSANPTGPLHVGHARGAVVGDVLASLLAKAGYAVTREYYINDAGSQVDVLARSAYLRYREALGDDIGEIPEGLYPGDYLVPVGQALAARDGDKWQGAEESEWLPEFRAFSVAAMMDLIRDDLGVLNISHDAFSSERALVEAGGVDAVMKILEDDGLIYVGTLEPPKGKLPDDWEERPQTLFRASDFGDDTDRPLKKSDGSWTYFASDLAYHQDKYQRGFSTLIDVWGADHGGYVKRVGAGVKALTGGAAEIDVKLCQMVRLLEDGEPAKMSKRSGNFVTLRDLADAVGKDVIRFIMLTRKNDAPLDFDLVKVREQSRDNPVFYVQYAHARTHSVARMAAEAFPDADFSIAALQDADLARLTDSDELALIRLLAAWPRTVEGAAETHEPHRLAFYLYDLAAAFHALWSKARGEPGLRFVVADDVDVTRARMALVFAVRAVVASGLTVMGVTPVDELRE
ncbi:MAG: arginine--tRNA ligase [Rhodospirillaceae bacterium]|jgi:arginyl-tRNA synthetase|nr:arginine--tRNA ligase [Rhodospirillaceae bacterium]MBT4771488.1 arginine--tRNA ligase [Rhodospirillaceae bacterium]MBT5356788.1 arginine--tRNA ligase [Rhodospirillaceae bacterium]MBT6311268.1 arginine--tRNA ligase [Rhodospirillaceae bacterium]MBT7364411.1 arginine--tRNA ligase [Rhodospirillaceae bacterium]